MMLGIDTALDTMSVAVTDGESTVSSIVISERNAHDEYLAASIVSVLKEASIAVKDLAGVAVSAGPGSFTGLRIGMAEAKGIAFAAEIPLLLVPTLDAIAAKTAANLPDVRNRPLAVIMDARKNDIYASLFTIDGGAYTVESVAAAYYIEEFLPMLPGGSLVTGDGVEKLAALGRGVFETVSPPDALSDAPTVARLGAEMLAAGRSVDPATAEPLYIREFRTTVPKKNV